jgi:hypothetical protein
MGEEGHDGKEEKNVERIVWRCFVWGEEVNIHLSIHLQKVAATTYLLKGEHNEANEIIRGYPAELGHSTSHNLLLTYM